MGFKSSNLLKELNYRRIIESTIDPSSGKVLADYTLASPVGNITVGDEELPTLGGVSF